MTAVLEFLRQFWTPAIIVGVISVATGAWIGYIGYMLNKRRAQFDTRTHIRKVFAEVFDLDRKIADDFASLKSAIMEKLPAPRIHAVGDTYALLTALDEELRLSPGEQREPELLVLVSQAANLHYLNQNMRNLLVYSVADLIKQPPIEQLRDLHGVPFDPYKRQQQPRS